MKRRRLILLTAAAGLGATGCIVHELVLVKYAPAPQQPPAAPAATERQTAAEIREEAISGLDTFIERAPGQPAAQP